MIAVIADEGDDLSGVPSFTAQASSIPKSSDISKSEPGAEPALPRKTQPSPSQEKALPLHADLPAGQRIFASPIAKKLALERGVPLAKIKGTGPEGRIIREDVEKYQPSSPLI